MFEVHFSNSGDKCQVRHFEGVRKIKENRKNGQRMGTAHGRKRNCNHKMHL